MKQFSKDLGNVSLAPKGKWSREQEYEKLALVYNACDNLSYVAKINVPSGIDIENREYWQPMNATGYADNNFINLTTENENGTITAYETLEEAVATILPINRRAGATLSFYNLNSDRLDRQAEFELWQFNSTDLANWENKDYWNNVYYNWNVFVGWYVGADGLKNHVKIPNVGQYAYVGTNLNDALLYQCRTNGVWVNTGIKVRNYISVVVSGNITIGKNGNWFSDGKDTGIPATPAVDEQLDNIIIQLQQHATEIDELQNQDVVLKSNIDSNFETINNKVDNIKTDTYNKIDTADVNLQNQITSNDTDIANLNTKHESLSKTVQNIAVTGGANTANNVTYNNDSSRLNAENAQDAIDEVNSIVTYDVSVRNSGVSFESLQALLSSSDLSTLIPTSVRHGGMSIRFVQSSDNKYMQYRLMKNSFSTTVSDWQGVDEKPIAGSHNLLKSGSILNYTQGLVECEYLPVTNLTVHVTLQEYNFIEGKEYILYYNNTSKSEFGFGIAQNGSGSQAAITRLYPNTKGTYVFTPSSNCNQVRTYAYTINVDGKLNMWIKLKEDVEVLEKDIKQLSEHIDYNSNNIKSINDVITGFNPINIGSESDGYYMIEFVNSDGKRHLPVNVSYFKGKDIAINLSDVDERSARRIGFTDDISDLSTINWTSFYLEQNFQSNVDKLIPITGNYLLISYKRSQNVICKVESGVKIGIMSDYFLNKVNAQKVVFNTFTSNYIYSQPIFNFLIGESYLIRYENKSGSSIGFGSGNNGTLVQGGYKTLENNTEGEFLFVPTLNANQIRLYVNNLSNVNGTIKFCVYSDTDINPLKNIDKTPTFISCFNKITCIGDSLTYGTFDVNAGGVDGYNNSLYSYPAFLQKHTGVDTINLGLGGRCACRLQDNTRSWYDDIVSEGKFIADNIGDIAIIALGTNDIYKYDSFTGDVSTDIDLTDRNNNALTSVGGYANIIQAIREINPRTIIFCVTISNERNTLPTRTAANTKIKAIANLFDECYVIDMQTYAEPSDTEAFYFSLYYKGSSHNNALGYELRSRQIISYIDWIIQHNPSLFGNIQFLGTNYYYTKS